MIPNHALSVVMTSVPGVWPAHPGGWAGLTVKEPTINIYNEPKLELSYRMRYNHVNYATRFIIGSKELLDQVAMEEARSGAQAVFGRPEQDGKLEVAASPDPQSAYLGKRIQWNEHRSYI